MSADIAKPRTLGPREAELVAWLEIERPPTVSVDSVVTALEWPRDRARRIVSQLAAKGWLQRMRRNNYEPLLGETAGIAVPNPWAALAGWAVPYYIGFASAGYELGLTPDRPGAVQVCVRVGTYQPRVWRNLALALIPLRSFSLAGTEEHELHGHTLRIASVEKTLLDSAAATARAGGVLGLARLTDRALASADWDELTQLAREVPRGIPAARRLAATLTLLGHEVPAELRRIGAVSGEISPIYLGSRATHGRRGEVLQPWQVIANVSGEALREEIKR